MSGFQEFPSFDTSSTSIPPFVFGSTPSYGPSFSTANFGFSSPFPSVSSSAGPARPFFGLSSSSSSYSTTINQNNDEATIKKTILEAVELLEEKSESGVFPQRKLQEIKHELEKKYPNIFSTKTYSHKNHDECYDDLLLNQEQEMNRYIQRHMSQIQKMERHLKIFGETEPELTPNYGANYPNNQTDYENNHGDETSNLFGNSRLGSDGCSALSFLASLLSGSGL